MRQEPERFQLGELSPNGRRRRGQAGMLDERLRADGLPGRDEFLHDPAQDLLLPWCEQNPAGRLSVHVQGILAVATAREYPRAATRVRGDSLVEELVWDRGLMMGALTQ